MFRGSTCSGSISLRVLGASVHDGKLRRGKVVGWSVALTAIAGAGASSGMHHFPPLSILNALVFSYLYPLMSLVFYPNPHSGGV